jgi:hypothetical protein
MPTFDPLTPTARAGRQQVKTLQQEDDFDRQRWQEELAELPALIGRWENELAGLPPGERTRREMYDWMIRRDRLRLETLAKWLAQADNEPA